VRIHPGHAEAHNNLGLALAQQGRIDEAIRHYSEAIRLLPDYFEAHGNLGAALAGTGRYADAINHFSIAVRLRPDHALARENLAQAHYDLGVMYVRKGDLQSAKTLFEEALRIEPNYHDARRALDTLSRQ
jgi:tetratricopeptide (TPR) repeat protein